MEWLAWRGVWAISLDYVSDFSPSGRKNRTRAQIVAMTIDLEHTTQKKSKKDRKTSDDRQRKERPSDDDLVLDREERKRKRKEKRREKEGAIDGALPFSMCFAEG
jgi:hypothetical protein